MTARDARTMNTDLQDELRILREAFDAIRSMLAEAAPRLRALTRDVQVEEDQTRREPLPDAALFKTRRRRLGYSQAHLARMLHTSRGLVADLENGRRHSAYPLRRYDVLLTQLETQRRAA